MNIHAKIFISSKIETQGSGETVYQIIGYPVTNSSSEENKKYYASTPNGKIELGGFNKAVADLFEIGKEYYLTFQKAE